MLLNEQEVIKLWDSHTVPVFGKSGINPVVFATLIEAELLEKLKAQEPFAYFSINDYGAWEETSDPTAHALYEHQLPPDDVVRDAARYRFLRDEAYLVNPVVAVVWKRNDDREESEWVNTVDGYSLDCHIDAAMKEMK